MRHTSLRSAQYLQRGGLLWDTPPRDLHSNCQCFQALYLFRRWALRHTSARSAQFLQVFLCVGHVFFQFRMCVFRTPPCDLHSFYNNICVSEVCPTRDFIILNKGRMTPPWRERAKRSQDQRRSQNFDPISVPSRFLSQIIQPKLYYEPAPI